MGSRRNTGAQHREGIGMGQYHYIANLTKRQYINPHQIGSGLKIMEQVGWEASPSTALFLLLACSNGRGGGDAGHHPLVGHWAGDQVAVIGDYSTPVDIPGHDAAAIFQAIMGEGDRLLDMAHGSEWRNISPQVREMMTAAVGARYSLKGYQQGRNLNLDTAGWVAVEIPG